VIRQKVVWTGQTELFKVGREKVGVKIKCRGAVDGVGDA